MTYTIIFKIIVYLISFSNPSNCETIASHFEKNSRWNLQQCDNYYKPCKFNLDKKIWECNLIYTEKLELENCSQITSFDNLSYFECKDKECFASVDLKGFMLSCCDDNHCEVIIKEYQC